MEHPTKASSERKLLSSITSKVTVNLNDLQVTHVKSAVYPEYNTLQARLNTYPSDWLWQQNITATDFSKAGFVYLETGFYCVQCHYCELKIRLNDLKHRSSSCVDAFDVHELGMSLAKTSCLRWELFRPDPARRMQGSGVDRSSVNEHESMCLETLCRRPKINLLLIKCRHIVPLCPRIPLAMADPNRSLGPKEDDIDLGGPGNARPFTEDAAYEAAIVCTVCGVASDHVKRIFFDTDSKRVVSTPVLE